MSEEYKCNAPGCERSFASINGLHGHQRVHKEKEPKQCPACNRIFSSEAGLNIHQIKAHGRREYRPPGIDLNRFP